MGRGLFIYKGENMRCALSFDENTALYEQKVKAWGELQSLDDEPAYKEDDIVNEYDKAFFRGVKTAFDYVCNELDEMVELGELAENTSHYIQSGMSGELCMHLFSIIDNQE
jgi:hypothetical protein